MDSDDMKAKLRDMVTARVKDDLDGAKEAFHQVLQAKMRARLNPTGEQAPVTTDDDTLPETTDESVTDVE